MKTRRSLFQLFLILMTFPSLIIWIGERTLSEAAQSENNGEDSARYNQALQIAEGVLTQLGDIFAQLDKEPMQNREDAQQAVASGFIIILPELLKGDEKHAQELGFHTGKDTPIEKIIQGAELLDYAFPVFEIHLNDLRTFSPGTGKDVKQLLFYANQLLWPISVDEKVQSSLTIRFTPNEQKKAGRTWRPTRWGRPNLIRQLTTAREIANQKRGFLVSVPSLNRNFFGYNDNTIIKFVPLVTDRLFKKGESLSAEYAYELLSDEAKNVDDSPR